MENTNNSSIETGAMTLVLLVKSYKSQMIALLLKNGVAVPSGASDPQIAMLMANLLKVSKSFFNDLNSFIQNPKVIQTLAGGIGENADYFRMSGDNFAGKRVGNAQYFRASGYMNASSDEDGFLDTGVTIPTGTGITGTAPAKTNFLSGLNLGKILSDGLDAFGKYDKNKTDREIANALKRTEQAGSGVGSSVGANPSGNTSGTPVKEGVSTTTIVVLSLVGVAVIGTIIYFVARPKS
jgi:hypothetical protein